MTDNNFEPITTDQVLSTYNGKANSCCCGCSGKHSYPTDPILRTLAGMNRGYSIDDDECSDRSMKLTINKLNKNRTEVEDGGSYWCYETPTRVYIAYKLAGAVANH